MNYKNRLKERNLKKIFNNIFVFFKFTSINLSFSGKIIMIGNIILLTSLFFPWLTKNNDLGAPGGYNLLWNSFQPVGGNIGFISLFIIMFITCITIFYIKSEKLKLALNISFKNYLIIILSGLFIIIIGIIYISFIYGLTTMFLENIVIGKGVILYILSGIVITTGGLIEKSNYNNKEYESYINEMGEENLIKNNKSNMKLPF